jgi:hypothetical protein
MAELEWQPTDDGYTTGFYRILRLNDGSDHHWRLVTVDDSAPAADFRRLTVAFQAADGLERARIRRSRILTHLTVGAVATVVVVLAAAVMNDLAAFLVTMGAIWLAVRSFVGATSEHFGDAWSWNRAPGTPRQITALDRAWAGVVDTASAKVVERVSAAAAASSGTEDEPKVRTLPPEPPG